MITGGFGMTVTYDPYSVEHYTIGAGGVRIVNGDPVEVLRHLTPKQAKREARTARLRVALIRSIAIEDERSA